MTWDQIKILFAVIFLGFLYSLYSRNRNKKSGFTRLLPLEHISGDDEGKKQYLISNYYKYQTFPGVIIFGFCFIFSVMLYYDIIARGFRLENVNLIVVNIIYGIMGVFTFHQGNKGYKEDRLKPPTPEFLQELRRRISYPSSKLIVAYLFSFTLTAFLSWLFIFSGNLSLY